MRTSGHAARRWRNWPPNQALRDYVQDRLGGTIVRPRWRGCAGPGCALDRAGGTVAGRTGAGPGRGARSRSRTGCGSTSLMIVDAVSHEAIYQALYVQGRGAPRRELRACLRTGRALRVPRARVAGGQEVHVTPSHDQPAARGGRGPGGARPLGGRPDHRAEPVGDRHPGRAHRRFTMLLHLPRWGPRQHPRPKNGPALAGHGAEAVRDAIAATIITLPAQLRRSLTWDQGAEMAQPRPLRTDTGIEIYFCDPHSPWQRGTSENTNGLPRQYFPKGTDLSRHSPGDLAAVAAALNSRPARRSAGRPRPRHWMSSWPHRQPDKGGGSRRR